MSSLQFHLVDFGPIFLDINQLVIAGWTGCDVAIVEHHIAELEALGVKRPNTIPTFYRVSTSLLSMQKIIQVPGCDSSGEVEFVIFSTAQGLLVGLGSDHTDRKVEGYGVTVSKQMCAKPIAGDLWRLSDVDGHWDELIMRTWRTRDGKRVLYQEGPVNRMLAPRDLIARYTAGSDSNLPIGTAMFCGTQPVLTDLGFGDSFEMVLFDPKLNRNLSLQYTVESLPIED